MKFIIYIFFFLCWTPQFAFAKSQNHFLLCTINQYQKQTLPSSGNNEMPLKEDDGGTFFSIIIMGVLATAFIFACIGVGIVFSILILLLLFVFVSSGVLSISIIVGLHKKSFQKGFLAALILTNLLLCTALGTIGFYFYNKMAHHISSISAIEIGAFSGAISGFILGHLEFFMIGRITGYFKSKLK